jgi:hypothetical protein
LKLERKRRVGRDMFLVMNGETIGDRATSSIILEIDIRTGSTMGQKDRSVFERYNITDEKDLKNAAQLMREYLNGQSEKDE